MTSTADKWPDGYVLRDGPMDGVIVHDRRPAFVHIEHDDGTGGVYRPSGKSDQEHAELERFDFEAIGT